MVCWPTAPRPHSRPPRARRIRVALVTGRRPKERPPHLKGTFLEYNWKGQRVIRSFPRKRRKRVSLYEASLRNRMASIMSWLSTIQEIEKGPIREALKTQNKRFGGLKGSASIRLRDIEYQRLSGRLFNFDLDGYGTVYSYATVQDIDDTLDWLGSAVGGVLTRGPTEWLNMGTPVLGSPYRFG